MKPFPLKSWPRNHGQLSWNKLAKNKEGFLPRSRLAEGILIKFPRLFPLNRKSSLWRTLRLSRKSILIKKQNLWWECYSVNIYFTGQQGSTACECSVRQWPAWLEFIQLHFLQFIILHAIISQIIELQTTVIASDTALEEISEFSFLLADVRDSGAGS